jgi:hypothetical protein
LKAWTSYANLHAFDTAKAAVVAGLIGTALAAAALKRFLASMPQLLAEVPMATRTVAMGAVHVLRQPCPGLAERGTYPGSMPRWRRPSRIWRVMPSVRIPHGTGTEDAHS